MTIFKLLNPSRKSWQEHPPCSGPFVVGPTASCCCPNQPTGKWFYNFASHNSPSLAPSLLNPELAVTSGARLRACFRAWFFSLFASKTVDRYRLWLLKPAWSKSHRPGGIRVSLSCTCNLKFIALLAYATSCVFFTMFASLPQRFKLSLYLIVIEAMWILLRRAKLS